METRKRRRNGAAVGILDTTRPAWITGNQTADSDVARRAHELYRADGCEHGHDIDHWLQAEREVRRAADVAIA
jgi:Protein of unknown function (DUF2934)